MSNTGLAAKAERVLGHLGLFLMLMVARLAERGYAPQHTISGRLGAACARRAIDAVAVIGWIADRLPALKRATAGGGPRRHDTYRVSPA